MPDFKQMAIDVQNDVITWRRDFHENPELSFEEVGTTRKIAELLRSFGYEDIRIGVSPYPETGVAADLNPGKSGKCIALRADIDALPVLEDSGVPYESKKHGVMHACGHDAHIAMLLGAAKILFQMREQIDGNVRFIFQPGEENYKAEIIGKGGAQLIVEHTNFMNGVDAIFGLHVWSALPSGMVCYKPGPFMATNMIVEMMVEGVGGHGAMPHTCVDPMIVISHIVMAWQTIVSREVNPFDMAVVTVGKIHSDGAWNVIPQKAFLTGGVRTLDAALMNTIKRRMQEMAESIAGGMRASVEFRIKQGAPPVVNDPAFTKSAVASVSKVLGEESVMETSAVLPSEDFAFYQQVVPGALFFLGIGDERKDTCYAQHHPKYKVDEDALFKGIAAASAVAFDYVNDR